MRAIIVSCLLMAAFAVAGIRIDVRNGKHVRFQQVVDVKVAAEQYESVKNLVVNEKEQSGLRKQVPFSWSVEEWDGGRKEYVLSILLTGMTNPNATRSFEFDNDDGEGIVTDLTRSSDESSVHISNQYFSLEHKAKGNGGIFSNIRFMFSGAEDKDLTLHDRSFAGGVGEFHIMNDRNATAKIIVANPLRVVVEAKTGYFKGDKSAIGNLKAVYHYVYNAFSPVVKVSARITRDDDTEWRELYFMHLTSTVRKYERFVMGSKGSVEVHELLPKGTNSFGAINANDWCVMEDGRNAVGVGGSTVAWDGSKEYLDFIRSDAIGIHKNFKKGQKSLDASATLYFGQSASDRTAYAKWLAPADQPVATVVSNVPSTYERGEFNGTHLLENNELRLAFAGAEDGFSCVGIERADHNGPVFCNAARGRQPLWNLHFCKGTDTKTMLTVSGKEVPPEQTSVERIEGGLKFLWKGVRLGDNGTFDAVATVLLNGDKSEWTLEIDNHSKEYGLWDSEFPIIGNVLESGTADALVPGGTPGGTANGNWGGMLYHNYKGSYDARYPSHRAAVQLMALMRDGYGLYYGIHDGAARYKNICMRDGKDLFIRVHAENMGVPGSGKKADFPVVLQIFKGGWWAAAKNYRNWALRQPWTARGPIKDDKEYPKLLTDMGFWFLLFSRTDEQVKNIGETMDRAFAKVPVPTGLHWYCWHKIPFDHSYPEYFPIKDGVKEITDRMTARGQVVMPYINGRLWDIDIDSFKDARPFSCMDGNGNPYIELYGSKRRLAPMCPYTKFWQDKINEVCLRMRDEVGFNGIYLDQIGSGVPALCFNPTHGHPLGGGRHWVDGFRSMLSRVRSMAAEKGLMIATECDAEPFMDNIHAFLVWIQREDTDVPLLPAIYSGYTTYFTSPQDAKDTLVAFRAAQGRDFMWGCQIGWHYFDILKDEYKDKFDFSMQLAELRLATKEFMVFGELVREIEPPDAVPPLSVTWNRLHPHIATLPAVQGYEWSDGNGRRCIYIINYSDSMQMFEHTLPTLPGCKKVALKRVSGKGTVPMAIAENGDYRQEYLEAGEILAFIVEPLADGKKLVKEARNYLKKGGDRLLMKTANEFLFSQSGLSFAMNRNVVTVAGEFTWMNCLVGNSGRKRTLKVEWPDGSTERIAFDSKVTRPHFKEFGASCEFRKDFVKVSVENGDGCKILPFNHIVRDAIQVEIDYPEAVFAGEEFMTTVLVGNSTSETKDATIMLMFPDDWTVEPSRTLAINGLRPEEQRMAVLKCLAPVSTQTKDLNISSMVMTGMKQHPLTVRRSRSTAKAAKAKSIRIDGKLDEWQEIAPAVVGSDTPACIKYNSSKYNGNDDCSAELRFAWNENYLYIAAKIKDDKHFQMTRGNRVWSGDSIQFAVVDGGPLPPSRSQDVSMLNEFAIAADETGPFIYSWCKREAGFMENSDIAVTGGDGEIIYEAAIPWESINLSNPFPGKKLGLSFVVADNDGKDLRGWLEWTPGIFGFKDPSAYGVVTLE